MQSATPAKTVDPSGGFSRSSLGSLLIWGLVQPVTLQPLQPGNTYFFTRLPHPGFLPGAIIQLLTSSDGYLGALGDVSAWGADAVINNPLELLNFFDLA